MKNKVGISALALAILSSKAGAFGFVIKDQSAEGQGHSFAGQTAKAYDASTIYYNPAGMSRIEENKIQGNLTAVTIRVDYSPETLGGNVGNLRQGDAQGGIEALAPTFYGIWDVGDDLKFGFSLNSPFGLGTNFDRNWSGAEYALKSELLTLTGTPSISYKLSEDFSIGGGIQIQYASAELSSQASPNFTDSTVRLRGDDVAYGYTVGALYEYSEAGRIGLSFRSEIKHTLKGSFQVSGLPAGNNGYFNSAVDFTTPASVSFGWFHQLNDTWALMADISWFDWSVFDTLEVVQESSGNVAASTEHQWSDGAFYALGTSYKYDKKITLRGGVAFDESAPKNSFRTGGMPDADRYWLSFGGSYKANDRFDWHFGYSYVKGLDASISEGFRTSSYSGDFDITFHTVSLGMEMSF